MVKNSPKWKTVLASPLLIALTCCQSVTAPTTSHASPKPASGTLRAVSLKVLQEHVLASGGKISPELGDLAGVTTVLGYINDAENHDIVVYGLVESRSRPPLRTEDFCVGLRNRWMKYATLRGNTYNYEYPGCSIDPNPATTARLNELGLAINASGDDADTRHKLQQWTNICGEWQRVRVLGTPFNCRFAALSVKADYDMKTLVDGNDPLPIAGFDSLMGMRLAGARAAILQKQPIPGPASSMNRFWFYPGVNRYVEDDGIVLIKQCPVTLLTEAMALTREREHAGLGHTEPMAEQFASDFTQLYSKVAEERPVYTDLENLFRFFILGELIEFKETPRGAGVTTDPKLANGFDLTCLLEGFPVEEIPVKTQLAGRSAIKEFNHTETQGNETSTYQLWLQSCGGVGTDHEVKPEEFTGPSPALKRLKTAILAKRTPGALSWDLDGNDPSVQEIQNMRALSELNNQLDGLDNSAPGHPTQADPAQGFVLPSQPNRRRKYCIICDGNSPNFKIIAETGNMEAGNSVSSLVDRLRNIHAFDADHLVLEATGFNGADLRSLMSAVKAEANKYTPVPSITFIDSDNPAEKEMLGTMLSPGVNVDAAQLSNLDSLLDQKDLSIPMQTRVSGLDQQFYLDVFSDNPQVRRELLKGIMNRLRDGRSSDNIFHIWNAVEKETIEKLQLKHMIFPMRVRNKNGAVESGDIVPVPAYLPI